LRTIQVEVRLGRFRIKPGRGRSGRNLRCKVAAIQSHLDVSIRSDVIRLSRSGNVDNNRMFNRLETWEVVDGSGGCRIRKAEIVIGWSAGVEEISSIRVDKTWIAQDYGKVFPGPAIF
jgi:hypothetical protein